MKTIQEVNSVLNDDNVNPVVNRRLKILEVASAFPGWGGTEIHLLNLAEDLVGRGHEVHISCRPGMFVETEAKKRGLQTIQAVCRRQNSWRPLGRYLKLIREGKYDVVHVHWDCDYKIPATAARLCGVPAVFLSHHSPYPIKKPFNRWLYKTYLYDRMIALSESVRSLLLSQGFGSEKVTTVHHGIDTGAFRDVPAATSDIREGWGVPSDAILIGMVGRIGPEKGVRTFVEALSELKSENIYGVFIGEGKLEKEMRDLVAKLGLVDKVIFAGFRLDVSNCMSALDIHVLASVWAEPCAAVLEQAMAVSKPVIGTNIGGTPEIVENEITGILVPPGDASALAAAMIRLANDKSLRERMGAAGRQRVDHLFNQERMVDKIEELYLTEYNRAVRLRASKIKANV